MEFNQKTLKKIFGVLYNAITQQHRLFIIKTRKTSMPTQLIL